MNKAVSRSSVDDGFESRDAVRRHGQLSGTWRRGGVTDSSQNERDDESSDRGRRTRDTRVGCDNLQQDVAGIEARPSTREAPAKDTLARLEAKLEQLGRGSDAQIGVHAARAHSDTNPLLRLEGKLNAVLEALASTGAFSPAQATSALQPGVSQGRSPSRRRSLREAVAEIAERQSALNASNETLALAGVAGASTRVADVGVLTPRPADVRASAPPRRLDATTEPSRDSDGLRLDIAAVAAQVRDLAPRGVVAALESRISDLTRRLDATDVGAINIAIGELRAHMQSIDDRLLGVQQLAAHPPGPNMSTLEQLVRDLGARIEATQALGAESQAADTLQHQIDTLATRLEATETGLASLPSLDRSIRDLFVHIEDTRSHAETVASHIAAEAVRAAIGEISPEHSQLRDAIASLRAAQEDADSRTRATLDVMQKALDKVVDRLGVVEDDLVEARVAHVERDDLMRATASNRWGPLASDLEPDVPGSPLDSSAGPAAPNSHRSTGAEVGFHQAHFIAAARRAAHVAQTEPPLVATGSRATPNADDAQATRAGLAAKSREYITSHKRPVLIALAAVLIIATTLAFLQPLPLGSTGQDVAEKALPSRVATYRPPRAPAIPAHILGSDAVATSSIASLPSRVGRSSNLPPTPTSSLPSGLAAAAEAGDPAALYTLAAAYAEGQTIPRDFARAADLYAKAADQGVVPARFRLGALYERGLGVVQDRARARSLYRQAAEAGSPRAMHNLAVLLADGDGKPDYEGAVTWFRRAAQLGVHDSEFNLAVLLARGLGVDRSLVQSYQWFAIAAEHGDADAAAKRDEVAFQLSASELSVAKALAAAFHPREPDPAAVEVMPPSGGWDGATAPVHLNSPRSKIS